MKLNKGKANQDKHSIFGVIGEAGLGAETGAGKVAEIERTMEDEKNTSNILVFICG